MARYQLYGRNQTGSMVVEAAMTEAGVAFDFVLTPRPGTDAERAAFARINPRLQVPVLIHPDGTVITEGPAILYHIADAFPGAGLIPPAGTSRRAVHDRWMSFFQANVYEGMLRELFPDRYTTDAAGAERVRAAATEYVRRHFLIFENQMGERPFLFGAALSVFDIYLWMLCFWIDADWLGTHCPRIHNHWTEAGKRPVLHRIAGRHFS